MKRVDESSALPFALLSAVSSRHRGLRHVELHQMKGSKSYQLVPGQRYSLSRGDAEPEHDEAPDDTVEEIAGVLWNAAREHHKRNGGDVRFRVRFYVADTKGNVGSHEAKFSVDDADDGESSGDSAEQIDAQTRRDVLVGLMHEMREYISQLHSNQEKHDTQRRGHSEEITKFTSSMGSMMKDVFTTIGQTMQQAFELRIDAFEDRAESVLEGAGAPQRTSEKPEWLDDTVASVKELLGGPVGQAGIGKLLGMTPKEVSDLMGAPVTSGTAGSKTGDETFDVRPLLRQLGMTLSEEQKAELAEKIGAQFGKDLFAAAMAPTPAKAISIVAGALDSLKSEEQAAAIDEVLDAKQTKIVAQIFDVLEKVSEKIQG